jgi:D-alanyl-D-alanine carboxypeptidase (penicillin-binding protein 5/6)
MECHRVSFAARGAIPERKGSPYLGAIVVNAETGDVVFEKDADALCYPASIVKLMVLLILQERIEGKTLGLSEKVPVTAEATRLGGSQLWLKEGESFPVEDLLYALMVRSANDAAVALAIHAAGSTDAFVDLMQKRADSLGMKNTVFHTVHGLPPEQGQEPDVSTPRDLALLSRELLKHPDVLKYTATKTRGFRNGTLEMVSHNKLLWGFDGCDGLKTGFFTRGGYSLAATAQRGGNRFIAIVVGSKDKRVRNTKTKELLALAFSRVPPKPAATPAPAVAKASPVKHRPLLTRRRLVLLIVIAGIAGGIYWMWRREIHGPPPLERPKYGLK